MTEIQKIVANVKKYQASYKFKIGDKVKIISEGWNNQTGYIIDITLTINDEFSSHYDHNDFDHIYWVISEKNSIKYTVDMWQFIDSDNELELINE